MSVAEQAGLTYLATHTSDRFSQGQDIVNFKDTYLEVLEMPNAVFKIQYSILKTV